MKQSPKLLLPLIVILTLITAISILLSLTGCNAEKNTSIGIDDITLYSDYDYSSNCIEKGNEYSFGYDNYDMYIATAISDKLIRVVNWSKDSSDDSYFEEDEEVGVFHVDDPKNGFVWIDEEHTAFYFNLHDPNKKGLRTTQVVTFSVLGTTSNKDKGTNFNENIISYIYEHNDSYFCKAIPLTETMIKIEAWRCVPGLLWDSVIYAYDVCIINTEKTTTDFTWTDNEHTSFSITMHDPKSGGYWKEEKLVYFIVENEKLLPPKSNNVSLPENGVSTEEGKTVNITIDCEENLILSRYGLSVWMDGKLVGSVGHGKSETFKCELNAGNHTLIVTKNNDNTVEGRETITITDNANFEYRVHCHSNRVDIEQTHYENMRPLKENEIKMSANASEYYGKNYNEIVTTLENLGFTNISTEAIYDLWSDTFKGEVKSVSIGGNSDFKRGDILTKDSPVVIVYRMPESEDPLNISLPYNAKYYDGMNYLDVEKIFRDMGFANIELIECVALSGDEGGEVCDVEIGIDSIKAGDVVSPDEKVYIKYYVVQKPEPVSYSTNDLKTAKKGNTGVFSYKKSGSYDIYYIIDFDEGYVYYFTEGNGSEECDRIKITSGDLNSVVIITYHAGDLVWQEGLHFKWVNQPDHLIVEDGNHLTWDFYPTNLNAALAIRNKKQIHDY